MGAWLAERVRGILYGALVALSWPLVAALFRLSVRGKSHLRDPGILVAPHRSYWDIAILCAACGPFHRITFLSRRGLLRNPLFAPFVWGFSIVIDREAFGREDYRKVLARASRAGLIGVFPEGTTRPGATPKPGAIRFAEITGRPLIPVNLLPHGPYPPARFVRLPLRFPRMEVRIGAPITVDELARDLPPGLPRPERYRRLSEKLMAHIQAL